MLKLTQVSKAYGSLIAVDNVSLEIPAGQIWALSGPNGAGKTTLLKIIAGILQPDQGLISLQDISPAESKKLVRYVPQKAGLYPNLTVGETLQFFAGLRGAENFEDVLARFRLSTLRHRLLRTLSGGQRQRVVVAQAFLGKGQLLLLDEPTANLDADTSERLQEELRRFIVQGGSVILSSHIAVDLEKELITHRVMMKDGAIERIM
ncbi:heme ABC exporter ATP-binding protein CcmA [Desulfosporosinus sp. SB140]|uniref:heme ABC exporter ATP-binding protein CcmA n=1 Tax=Desulfosporosinus paludis TaxID=3115649 RepID=UPI00388E4EDE